LFDSLVLNRIANGGERGSVVRKRRAWMRRRTYVTTETGLFLSAGRAIAPLWYPPFWKYQQACCCAYYTRNEIQDIVLQTEVMLLVVWLRTVLLFIGTKFRRTWSGKNTLWIGRVRLLIRLLWSHCASYIL